MMIKNYFLFSGLVASASLHLISAFRPAFIIMPQNKAQQFCHRFAATKNSEEDLVFRQALDPVNIDRAIDCAEHFGKCSTKEMEDLRDSLHKERLQTMIFGGTVVAPEEAFQHHILEEELSLQLSLLNDATPPSTMFPEANDDDDAAKHAPIEPTVGEKILMVEEAIVEENLGDALAICIVLGALIAAPQLLQL